MLVRARLGTVGEYGVCYCPGPCRTAADWYEVPGTLRVSDAVFGFSTEPAVVTTRAASFSLTVARPTFLSYSDPRDWRIKLVATSGDCALHETDWRFGGSLGAPARAAGDHATWDVSITASAVGAKYFVCFLEPGDAWAAITDAGQQLVIAQHPLDQAVFTGVHRRQYVSAEAGETTDAEVSGVHLPSASFDRVGFTSGTCGVDPWYVHTSGYKYGTFAASASDALATTFPINLGRGVTPGQYKLCYCDASSDAAAGNLSTTDSLFYPHANRACRSTSYSKVNGTDRTWIEETGEMTTTATALYGAAVDHVANVTLTWNLSVEYAPIVASGPAVEDLVVWRSPTHALVPRGVAVDAVNGHVYWTEPMHGRIQRAGVDGRAAETVVADWTGNSTPEGLALDLVNNRLYWTDPAAGKMQRAWINGSWDVEDVLTGLDSPGGLAVDAAGGKVYWVEAGESDALRRADLDGAGAEDIVGGLADPLDVAVDGAGGNVYWVDGTGTMRTAALDGSLPYDAVVDAAASMQGVALDAAAERVYWTDAAAGSVRSAFVNGTDAPAALPLLRDPPGGGRAPGEGIRLHGRGAQPACERLHLPHLSGGAHVRRELLGRGDVEAPRDDGPHGDPRARRGCSSRR